MKIKKLTTTIITILLFSSLLFAGNPEQIAGKMVLRLSKDIALTDSQKNIIRTNAKIYVTKMDGANSIASDEEKLSAKIYIVKEYRAVLDSVLTASQKTLLITKRNERKEAMMNKLKSKK